MKKLLLKLTLGLAIIAPGLAGDEPMTARERTLAWVRSTLADVPDVPGLPRVFLIGDSVSMGYTLQVRHALEGIANVHRPPQNSFSTAVGVAKLDAWLGNGHWDVIHFNFGLHDNTYLDANGQIAPPDKGTLEVPLPQYEANLRKIVLRLKQTGARLIFATTTPMPVGSTGRVPGAEVPYNAAAVKIMRELAVTIDDLYAYTLAHPGIQRPRNIHFTDAGYDQLAAVVTSQIKTALAKSGPASDRKENP